MSDATREGSAPATTGNDSAAQVILRRRAADLARAPAAAERPSAPAEVVVFALGAERYAFESERVREVSSLRPVTPVPCTPDFVLGVMSVRGRIVSLLDLCRLLDVPRAADKDVGRRAVVLADGAREVAFACDDVVGVRVLDTAALQPTLPTLNGARVRWLRGVADDGLVVLDAARLLSDPELVVREDVVT